jgi:hypothetical protein
MRPSFFKVGDKSLTNVPFAPSRSTPLGVLPHVTGPPPAPDQESALRPNVGRPTDVSPTLSEGRKARVSVRV